MNHKALSVLVALSVPLPTEAQLEFQDPLCDAEMQIFAGNRFIKDIEQQFGGRSYNIKGSWKELTRNPLTTPLEVEISFSLDLGDPFSFAYWSIAETVSSSTSCEVNVTFHSFSSYVERNRTGFDARVDVDYNVCADGRYLYKQDDQTFKFGAVTTASVEAGVPVIRTTTYRTDSGFPSSVRLLGQGLGALSGAFIGMLTGVGLGGAILGATEGDKAVQKKYDEAVAQMQAALLENSTTQSLEEASVVALISDYKPIFGTPVFSYVAKSYFVSAPHLIVAVPLTVTVPPAQNCEAKKAIKDFFDEQSTKGKLDFRAG
jgi:hypothetical protein